MSADFIQPHFMSGFVVFSADLAFYNPVIYPFVLPGLKVSVLKTFDCQLHELCELFLSHAF